MSLIRRLSATLTSSVDRAVSKVENHDAIVNAALKDTQHAAARSRVRLERIRKDGLALNNRYESLTNAEARWTERARNIAATDEAKALECLRRRRDCEKQRRALQDSIEKHNELEARISEQVKKIEARINEVTQQRNMMRSRQSVADAMRAIHDIEGVSYTGVEDTFDRWEINLGETEIMVGSTTATDPLESGFLADEDAADLRAELDLLVANDEGESS